MESKKWFQSKTIWASIGIVLSSLAGFLSGKMDLITTATTILTGLGLGSLRLGINKPIE